MQQNANFNEELLQIAGVTGYYEPVVESRIENPPCGGVKAGQDFGQETQSFLPPLPDDQGDFPAGDISDDDSVSGSDTEAEEAPVTPVKKPIKINKPGNLAITKGAFGKSVYNIIQTAGDTIAAIEPLKEVTENKDADDEERKRAECALQIALAMKCIQDLNAEKKNKPKVAGKKKMTPEQRRAQWNKRLSDQQADLTCMVSKKKSATSILAQQKKIANTLARIARI